MFALHLKYEQEKKSSELILLLYYSLQQVLSVSFPNLKEFYYYYFLVALLLKCEIQSSSELSIFITVYMCGDNRSVCL